MFAARDIIVCLALFVVMYAALSCMVGAGWAAAKRLLQKQPASSPHVLFGLRLLPLAVSTLFAVFFTFPSFWLMETPSLDEDLPTFLLAGVALVLLTVGIFRVWRATRLTRKKVLQWLDKATESTTLSSASGAPAVMLVGVCRPRIMVSDMATAVLSENELRLAVRHELAHKRSWDNLKKALINATPFPGMSGIERAWREAAELAADDTAVESRQDALDLATALIKLCRSAKRWTEPEMASALVCGSSAVSTRVHRLLEWRTAKRISKSWPWATLAALAVTATILSNYGAALAMTHRLTELIVP